MKKAVSIFCILSMIFTMTACNKKNYAGQTVVGQITKIDGSKVTLLLGSLSQSEGEEQAAAKADDSSESKNSSAPQDDQTKQSGTAPQDDQTKQSGTSSAATAVNLSTTQNNAASENGSGVSDNQSAPSGNNNSGDQKTPPEKPSGNNGSDDQKTPPEKPSGDNNSDDQKTPPEMPSGGQGGPGGGQSDGFTATTDTAQFDLSGAAITKDEKEIEISALAENDILKIVFNDKGTIESVEVVSVSAGGKQPSDTTVDQGSAATTLKEAASITDKTYKSTGDDENALRVDGATVTLDGITVNKSSGASSNTENGDFYGANAALLVTNGATATIKNATVTSTAQNGNGVFSYGSGTAVTISDSKITTTKDNSGGIQTTGGGTMNAENLTVSTAGNSSAAIRSDRGGGTVTVNGGSYVSRGYNSPAVYSTAAISVQDATLTAENSEALVIEGQNSITLKNCTVSGNMSDTKGSSSDENVHNVMIYQSMSGDAAVGTSSFSMTGGSLTGQNGDMFYVTNTACKISLSGVTINQKDSDANFMTICGNSASHGWGTAGKNGAQVTFTAENQSFGGNIVVDSISTLSMTLKSNSTFTGTITVKDNAAGGTAVSDNAVITVEKGSVWNLSGDCVISKLTINGTINFNGHTITLADGTVLSK